MVVVDFPQFPVFSVTPQIKGRTSRQTSNDDSVMTHLAVPDFNNLERRGSLDNSDSRSLQDPDLGDSSLFAR